MTAQTANWLEGRNKKETRAIEKFFDAMQLPLPAADEQTASNDGDDGFIVFLDRYGCVIRATNDQQFPRLYHYNILQPLGSRSAGGLRIDINPGIICPVATKDDVERLAKILRNDGLRLRDDYRYNCGILPGMPDPAGQPFLVSLDPAAVAECFKGTHQVVRLMQGSPQERLYRPLKDIFNAAWPANRARPDPAKIRQFWNLCAEMKQEGKLVAGWLSPSYEPTEKRHYNIEGGRRYANRLMSVFRPPAFSWARCC